MNTQACAGILAVNPALISANRPDAGAFPNADTPVYEVPRI
jgi:hypothetical protein